MKLFIYLSCVASVILARELRLKQHYQCDDASWVLSKDNNSPTCYKLLWFENNAKYSFNESKSQCEAEGGYVASIKNSLQQTAVVEAISLVQQNSSASQMFYIGLRDFVTSSSDTSVDYKWDHDGEPIGSFTTWLDAHPDEPQLDCFAIYPKKGLYWWNMNCAADNYIYGVVCAKDAGSQKKDHSHGDSRNDSDIHSNERD